MGNKQVKLGLRLDDKTFTAGSLVSGRVYLSITREQRANGLFLLLQGEEYTQIAHDEHDSHHSTTGHRDFSTTHREIDHATSSLVNMDVALTTFPSSKITPGQYEFPFEWELPSNLPGSMYCSKGDSHCEIRYHMTAYLRQDNNVMFRSEPQHSATQAVCIVARPTSVGRNTGIVIDLEVVRIKSCCFDSGQVSMGWDVDKTVASPDSVMKIGICGANESKVEIECLRVRLMETVSWSAHGRTEEQKSVLTESQVSTANLPQWHSNMHHGHAYQHVAVGGQSSVVETQLLLPTEARDTYSGGILQVRHSLVVTAVTPPCHTTVESGALIRVQRQSSEGEALSEADPVMSSYDTMAPTLVEADILPEDWRPQEAQVVTLPASSAVLLDTNYVPPVASAPDESLLTRDSLPSQTTTTLSDLLESLACSSDPVSTVSRELNNPAMAATIQNLTPRQYVQVLQAANRNVPAVARLVAGAMDEQFQCRHVLACVWSLSPQVRMEVLREVAPLASDLDSQKSMVERELDEQELIHFRAALINFKPVH